jgi:FlaA1/EpsC-like NDP-sugar epimerase
LKKYIKAALILFCDIVIIAFSTYAALLLRHDLSFEKIDEFYNYTERFLSYLPYNVIITVIVFIALGLYNTIWEFAGVSEAVRILTACFISTIAFLTGSMIFKMGLPRSSYIIYMLLFMCLTLLLRFSNKTFKHLRNFYQKHGCDNKKIMIIGAGRAGDLLIRDINNSSKFSNSEVVCVIDDDPEKIGSRLCGIKVVGTRKDIPEAVRKYSVNQIIYSIPSALSTDKAEILNICKETKCELKTLPSIYQLVNGQIDVSKLRAVEIEDLLGRRPIKIDTDKILGYVEGKTILVTGGGGSIGSELCRQIARHKPGRLIILDIYENNAYDIQNELKSKCPELNLTVLIGSVRDEKRINSIFETYHPDIVYHAAAHKHVPLMEDSPNEAIKNNVFGTLITAKAAHNYGAKRFVLISTDKAVNPTNVMGATKRICEMIIQCYNRKSDTEFVAVRFGNVLGSNGSVVPLFKKQIKEGGPVTVMHPDIIRYFMTITEAVSLVIEAGAIAKGGEIFILDMGQPVKILDLAEMLIKLSGYKPYEDIDIKITGLRPGEKLYEELLMAEEGMTSTQNELIHVGKPIEINDEEFFAKLEKLQQAIKNENCNVRQVISEIVPTYKYKTQEEQELEQQVGNKQLSKEAKKESSKKISKTEEKITVINPAIPQ